MKTGTNIYNVIWTLLMGFLGSEVKGRGHSDTKCTFAAEAYIATM